MIEMRHLFYNSMLPVFMGPNKLFQRERPLCFFLYDLVYQFLTNRIGNSVNICEIKSASTLKDVNLENTVSDSQLFIGIAT